MQQKLAVKQNAIFFTIGYQSHTLQSFVRLLKSKRIQLLVDVRQNPISRKPGFSKSRLSIEMPLRGIEYVHYPSLGTPPPIRSIYFQHGPERALKQYERYLLTKVQFVHSLVDTAADRRVCLMCLEKDPNLCHRGSIARKVGEITGCQPTHLM
jgi:uncharacterized protein (DUF488 family)